MATRDRTRIGILVVAYNAASTLADVLDRIPDDFRPLISEILVSDDHSQDSTYLVGLGYQQLSDLPITVVRQPRNLGYGGNQKAGYQMAMDRGLDIVVMLHGDGQYAPECLPAIIQPLVSGEAEAVFGSRMMTDGGARDGGMPLYKYVGNRVLTSIENTMLGTNLSEFHSGYRAYSVNALRRLPIHLNSDGFNFDTQIIVQLHDAGMRIVEVPIPTYYGDEICYVNGVKYARDVVTDVIAYRLHKLGLGDGTRIALADDPSEETTRARENTAYRRVVRTFARRTPSRILHLNCGRGHLSDQLRQFGHYVVGVHPIGSDELQTRTDEFIKGDLDDGIPIEAGGDFDVVLATDVIGNVHEPNRLLADIRSSLSPDGSLVLQVPNIGHWYPRLKMLTGLFSYDRLGILGRTNLRFFTRRSARRMLSVAGFEVRKCSAVGIPLSALGSPRGSSLLKALQAAAILAWPTMFGYQFVFEATVAERTVDHRRSDDATPATS